MPPSTRLDGQRILITQADTFMGPDLCRAFSALGAEVIASTEPLAAAAPGQPGPTEAEATAAPRRIVAAAGRIDALVLHLAIPAPATRVEAVDDAEWRQVFAHLVDPMPRLAAAVLPQMLARRDGRILVMGSAGALRGQRRTATYSAARGAQLAWVQSVGLELAPQGVRVNAIAQNFVENPTYYGPEVQANPRFQERLQREVPLGRLVRAEEDAAFAAYLLSDAAACFVGQVFPLAGGWALR